MTQTVARSYSVTPTGIGKPDYSREVSEARERKGFTLHYLQTLGGLAYVPTDQVEHPYAVSWVKPVLAPAASAHMVDYETGDDTPYTIPEGYTFTIIHEGYTHNQDVELWVYFDDLLFGCFTMGMAGNLSMLDAVVPFSSADFDPTGATSHTIDPIVINAGAGNLEGAFSISFILEAVSTPPLPTIKQCKCPFCNHKQEVAVGTTRIICKECGKLYIVRDFSKIKHL